MLASIFDALKEPLLQMFVTIILAVIGLGTTWVLAKIGETQEKLQAKAKNEILNNTLERAGELAKRIVGNIEETSAKYIREAVKNGNLDREELLALGAEAYCELIDQLGIDAVLVLEEGLTDVGEYLQALIEDEVRKIKNESQLGN